MKVLDETTEPQTYSWEFSPDQPCECGSRAVLVVKGVGGGEHRGVIEMYGIYSCHCPGCTYSPLGHTYSTKDEAVNAWNNALKKQREK